MAYLRIATLNGATATIEVGYLTLILCGYQFGSERQADGLPSISQRDIAVGNTLIPHAMSSIELITNRTIEVLLVHQQLVVGGCEIALYQMTMD